MACIKTVAGRILSADLWLTVNTPAVTGDGRFGEDGGIQMIQFNLEENEILK